MEFWELCSIKTTPDMFIQNGFKVISFGKVKDELIAILKDRETAIRYHLYNHITDNDARLKDIYGQLEKIVFKESRGNSSKMAIGWENGNSYLQYHSGIIYKWFPN